MIANGQNDTRESIIHALQSLAQKLGRDTLSAKDLQGVLTLGQIKGKFATLGNALEAAGLRRKSPGENFAARGLVYDNNVLFQELLELEQRLGHEPTGNETKAFGRFTSETYKRRFGKWKDVVSYYRKWEQDEGFQATVGETQSSTHSPDAATANCVTLAGPAPTRTKPPSQFYGEPIDFRGVRHAPINEQGVVYLFGMVSRELGFYIEAVQQGFPDCEGKFLYDSKRNLWAKARIEFEFKSSNFSLHGHDPNQCDFIVCWENDWPDCPINVIELRKEILKLPSR